MLITAEGRPQLRRFHPAWPDQARVLPRPEAIGFLDEFLRTRVGRTAFDPRAEPLVWLRLRCAVLPVTCRVGVEQTPPNSETSP
jgi:hypothetical protein